MRDQILQETDGTAYTPVDSSITALLTRFRVRSLLDILRFYILYRRIKRDSAQVEGLLTTGFFWEGISVCYVFSLWTCGGAILQFNSFCQTHISAANWSFGRLAKTDGHAAELWSAQFRLTATSPHNLRWRGIDMGALISRAGQMTRIS